MPRKRTRDAEDSRAEDKQAGRTGKHDDSSSDDEVTLIHLQPFLGVLTLLLTSIQDFDVVNVDFEWFNFDPDIDFHGVKTLLRQLFDVDSANLNLSAITDLCLQQRTIGSTVKVDDKANDAYAFLTALNLRELRHNEAVVELTRYLMARAGSAGERLSPVVELLQSQIDGSGTNRLGLVLADRLINMPSEIFPPMYNMLLDELEAAVEDGEPYEFTHYLLVSKTYQEVRSTIDDGDGSERKSKKAKETQNSAMFHFHPEDETFYKYAAAQGSYEYTREDENVADSKRAFQDMGIKSFGSLILIDAAKFRPAVQAITEALGAAAA
jgi:protein BCP1